MLQAHFSRVALPLDVEGDQKRVLAQVLPLLYAMVDVLSAHGWLQPALTAGLTSVTTRTWRGR